MRGAGRYTCLRRCQHRIQRRNPRPRFGLDAESATQVDHRRSSATRLAPVPDRKSRGASEEREAYTLKAVFVYRLNDRRYPACLSQRSGDYFFVEQTDFARRKIRFLKKY